MSLRPKRTRESRPSFERLTDQLDRAFVWQADAETLRVTYISPGCEALLGYPRERCLAMDLWATCTHSEDLARLTGTLDAARAEGSMRSCEHRCVTSDGRELRLHTVLWPLSEGRSAQKLEGVSREISAARDAVGRRTADHFGLAVMQTVREGAVAVDRQGRITFLNPAAERMLGWKAEEVVHVEAQKILQPRHMAGVPLPPADDPASIAIRTDADVASRECFFRRRHGDYFQVSCRAAPLRQSGQTEGAVLVFRDLSERCRLENALRESNERFQELTQNMLQGVLTHEPDGNADFVNKHWSMYTGHTREFLRSKPMAWFDALYPDDRDQTVRLHVDGVRSATRFATTVRIRRAADGAYRWHFYRCVPLRNAQQDVVKFLVTCTDVDDARRAEESLREVDRRRDELLAMLGHELRNPLAPIASAAEVLRVGDQAARERAGVIIERQVERMGRLIDELLDVADLTTGRIELDVRRIDLRAVVERAVDEARQVIDQHQHELELSQPEEPLWMNADAARIGQAVMHLLSNSATYTPPRGRIEVVTQRDGDDAILRVSDNGVGMAADLLPRVFQPFTQGRRPRDRAHGGLGVGLAIVRSVVELHGGTVEAQAAEGEGSRFVLHLPLASPASAPALAAVQPVTPPARPLRILVVDDNVDLAQSLAMVLKAFHHEVRIAYDGATAVGAALAFLPEVVFLDIGLPDMDGNDVARRLRRQAALRDATLVALTADGQESDRERSSAAGFDHHLTKPARFAELEEILKSRQAAR